MGSEIYVYLPNLIGYCRIILTVYSFLIAFEKPVLFLILYLTGFILDAIDGMVARYFDLCSKFGSVLDMVTDRTSTMGLVMVLCHMETNPSYVFIFILANVLDMFSHWFQMYANLLYGKKTHKETSNYFLKIYYTNKFFSAIICLGQELFYIGVYITYSKLIESNFYIFSICMFPLYLIKQFLNIVQLIDASDKITNIDYYQ